MGQLVKMKLLGYNDNLFNDLKGQITLQINPATLQYQKGIDYGGGESIGTSADDKKFDKHKTTTLSFDTYLDETGVVPLETGNIPDTIELFESVVYDLNSETHEPCYIQVNWGSFLFKGRLSAAGYDYTLFRPDGSPLRVKLSVTVEGYMAKQAELKTVGRQSPDLTRVVRVVAGDTLPLLCHRIYGDPTYCTDVARVNGLSGLRGIPPGVELIFPPLQRGHGN